MSVRSASRYTPQDRMVLAVLARLLPRERTVRDECLDWTLIWNPQHLQRILTAYVEHYNAARPHRGIGLAVPVPSGGLTSLETSTRAEASIERVDVLGGLIHEYRRAA
jgi:putative transposase